MGGASLTSLRSALTGSSQGLKHSKHLETVFLISSSDEVMFSTPLVRTHFHHLHFPGNRTRVLNQRKDSFGSGPPSLQTQQNLHGLRLLLGEHSDAEISVLVRLEGGWDDQVLSRWQLEAGAHLPQVDEGLRPRRLSVGQEEVLVQVDIPLSAKLQTNSQSGKLLTLPVPVEGGRCGGQRCSTIIG